MFAPGNAWSPTQAFQEEEILLLSSGDSSGVLVTLPQQRITYQSQNVHISKVETLELSDTN